MLDMTAAKQQSIIWN